MLNSNGLGMDSGQQHRVRKLGRRGCDRIPAFQPLFCDPRKEIPPSPGVFSSRAQCENPFDRKIMRQV